MKLIDTTTGSFYVAAGAVVFRTRADTTEVDVFQHEKCGDSRVVSMAFDSDHSRLFVGYANKCVVCYSTSGSLSATAVATLRKQPTAIQYTTFRASCLDKTQGSDVIYEVVLASDKAGEVFALNASSLSKQALLAGHTASVIVDMAIHTLPNGKQIVATADRDEKVRISHFPDMENIATFCLAHKSVVSSVCFVQVGGRTLLQSTGWDHKLILWDALKGEALHSVNFLPENDQTDDHAASAATEEKQEDGEEEPEDGAEDPEADPEEDPEGKQYDELSAGNYPFKVVCSAAQVTEGGAATVVVLFKGIAQLKVLTLRAEGSGFTLTEQSTVTLAAAPMDAFTTGGEEVCVVQALPQGLQVFRLGGAGEGVQGVQEVTGSRAWAGRLVEAVAEKGLDFGGSDDSTNGQPTPGLKKHTLDKRFNTSENLQLRTGRGSKRSKRANRGQP